MATQFIINDKGEKTSVIIPIDEFEELMHQNMLLSEPTEEYKTMMDEMSKEEKDGTAEYISLEEIKKRFPIK